MKEVSSITKTISVDALAYFAKRSRTSCDRFLSKLSSFVEASLPNLKSVSVVTASLSCTTADPWNAVSTRVPMCMSLSVECSSLTTSVFPAPAGPLRRKSRSCSLPTRCMYCRRDPPARLTLLMANNVGTILRQTNRCSWLSGGGGSGASGSH